jgi:hypothetical protein
VARTAILNGFGKFWVGLVWFGKRFCSLHWVKLKILFVLIKSVQICISIVPVKGNNSERNKAILLPFHNTLEAAALKCSFLNRASL